MKIRQLLCTVLLSSAVRLAASTPVLQFLLYTDKDHMRVLPVATNPPLGQWCQVAAVSGKGGMRSHLSGVLAGENACTGRFAAIGTDSLLEVLESTAGG